MPAGSIRGRGGGIMQQACGARVGAWERGACLWMSVPPSFLISVPTALQACTRASPVHSRWLRLCRHGRLYGQPETAPASAACLACSGRTSETVCRTHGHAPCGEDFVNCVHRAHTLPSSSAAQGVLRTQGLCTRCTHANWALATVQARLTARSSCGICSKACPSPPAPASTRAQVLGYATRCVPGQACAQTACAARPHRVLWEGCGMERVPRRMANTC